MSAEEKREIEADWEKINLVLSRMAKPPAGLEQRILSAVQRDDASVSKRESSHRSWWRRIASAAAVVAAIAVIFAIRAGDETTTTVTEESELSHLSEKDYHLNKPLLQMGKDERAVGERTPLKLAGVEGKKSSAAEALASSLAIGPNVRHIWIVKDLGRADELLKKVSDVNGKKMAKSEKNGDAMIYSLSLSDTELQNLVSMLSIEGWALASPDYPQPLEEAKIAFSGRKVLYEIYVVKQ